ncbi:hypothetical protein ACS0TY_029507 [Phlomoides rotata]
MVVLNNHSLLSLKLPKCPISSHISILYVGFTLFLAALPSRNPKEPPLVKSKLLRKQCNRVQSMSAKELFAVKQHRRTTVRFHFVLSIPGKQRRRWE